MKKQIFSGAEKDCPYGKGYAGFQEFVERLGTVEAVFNRAIRIPLPLREGGYSLCAVYHLEGVTISFDYETGGKIASQQINLIGVESEKLFNA